MKNNNNKNNKYTIFSIILFLIIYTTYSVKTFPIPAENNNDDSPSLSPVLDNPNPSLPTLMEIKFDSIPYSGEFWEMIRTTDYSDKNFNNRQHFGTTAYFSPVLFNGAYNKFGPRITYNNKNDIDPKYKNIQWYKICYLETCMNVVFRRY